MLERFSTVSTIAFPILDICVETRSPWQPKENIAAFIEAARQNDPKPPVFDGPCIQILEYRFDIMTKTMTLAVAWGKFSTRKYTGGNPEFRKKFRGSGILFLTPGSLVLTNDDKLFFARRPKTNDRSQGTWDIPCGHPQGVLEIPQADTLYNIVLQDILARELGYQVHCIHKSFLVALLEEPQGDIDTLSVTWIEETSEFLIKENAKQSCQKEFLFLNNTPTAIKDFLLKYGQGHVSRPVAQTLVHYLETAFGQETHQKAIDLFEPSYVGR